MARTPRTGGLRGTWAEKVFGPRTIGLIFVAPGILHLLRPQIYEPIMPPQLPAHRELIYASGVAEIVGGALYVPQRTRRFASWWLAALLVAVFPSNVYMATQEQFQRTIPGGKLSLLLRLPIQFLGIWWVLELRKRTSR